MTEKSKRETKKEPKSVRVRALLAEGKSAVQIAAMLGVTRQYVYSLKFHDKRKATMGKPVLAKKRGPGRPKGSGKKKLVFVPQVPSQKVLTLEQYVASLPSEPKPMTFWQRVKFVFTGKQ